MSFNFTRFSTHRRPTGHDVSRRVVARLGVDELTSWPKKRLRKPCDKAGLTFCVPSTVWHTCHMSSHVLMLIHTPKLWRNFDDFLASSGRTSHSCASSDLDTLINTKSINYSFDHYSIIIHSLSIHCSFFNNAIHSWLRYTAISMLCRYGCSRKCTSCHITWKNRRKIRNLSFLTSGARAPSPSLGRRQWTATWTTSLLLGTLMNSRVTMSYLYAFVPRFQTRRPPAAVSTDISTHMILLTSNLL